MGLVLVALYDGVLKLYRTSLMSARGEQTPCEGALGYDTGDRQPVPRKGERTAVLPIGRNVQCVHVRGWRLETGDPRC